MSKHFRFKEDPVYVIRSREAYIKFWTVSVLLGFFLGVVVGKVD